MVGPIKPDIAPILAIQKQQLIADPNKQHAGNLIQAAQIAGVSSKVSNVTTDKDFWKGLSDENSPSVSQTLGDDDTDSGSLTGAI